jgi:hypothetical protein
VKETWKVSLAQKGLLVEEGKEYLLEFRARAQGERTMFCTLSQSQAPYANLGLGRSCDIDEAWRMFRFRFRATMSDQSAQVRFEMAASNKDVDLQGVSFRELSSDAPATWELIVHKGCDASLSVADGQADVTRVMIGKTEEVLMPWHVRAVCGGIQVVAGENYTLKLRARADQPRGVVCSVNHAEPPYRNLGLYQLFTLKENWETYQVRFRADFTDENAQVELSLGNSDIDVELGEISLEGLQTVAASPDRSREAWINYLAIGFVVVFGGIAIFIRERIKRRAPIASE